MNPEMKHLSYDVGLMCAQLLEYLAHQLFDSISSGPVYNDQLSPEEISALHCSTPDEFYHRTNQAL